MDFDDIIKQAGLKSTPQRRSVYAAMSSLGHATLEEIDAALRSLGCEMPPSTLYRVLDSFCRAGLLMTIPHPETGKIYYDITVREHHHCFRGNLISDLAAPGLSQAIRSFLKSRKIIAPEEIDRIQVQLIVKH